MKEAERRDNEERVRFFKGLEKEIKCEWVVWREAVPVYIAIMPATPFEGWRSEVVVEEKARNFEVGDEMWRSESSCSFVTAKGIAKDPIISTIFGLKKIEQNFNHIFSSLTQLRRLLDPHSSAFLF